MSDQAKTKGKMSKAKLIREIQSERELLEETLAQFSNQQMTKPSLAGGWSVKDLLAHISAWEQKMTGWLEEILDDETPEMLPPGTTWEEAIDQINREIYLENQDKRLDQVLDEFHTSYANALEIVEAVPEGDLINPRRFDWRAGDPLWHMVAENTCWHYAEHREMLES